MVDAVCRASMNVPADDWTVIDRCLAASNSSPLNEASGELLIKLSIMFK